MSYTLKNVQTQSINGVAPEFKPSNDYYVSKGGNDTTGKGGLLSPYLTIQKAITVCEALPFGTPKVVHVSSGTYTENLTISKPRISILGTGRSMNQDTGSCIGGTVTIMLQESNTDVNNNNVRFNSLLISNKVQVLTGVSHFRLFFTDCYLYSTDTCLGVLVGLEIFKVYIDSCSISSSLTTSASPLLSCTGINGMLSITNSKLTAKGNSQIVCKTNCKIDSFANNVFTSDSTSSQAPQILEFRGSFAYSIGNCAFVYSSATPKTNATYNSCGVLLSGSATLVIVQCFFSLLGLPAGENAIINSGSGSVIFGNNVSSSSSIQYGSSASGISGTLNVNKFEMTKVL